MNEPVKTQAAVTEGSAGPASVLEKVVSLYEHGQYIDAYAAGQSLGPLQKWRSAEGRVVAGRLANNLGAPRLSRAIHWLALREFPEDPYCLYYGGLAYWSRFGPVRTWERFRDVDMPNSAAARVRADWLAMKALLLSAFRDFSRADQLLIEALELDPGSSWLHVQLCEILDYQDCHEDALRAAREALKLQPWFRPAIQSAGHKLVQLRRDDEALSLLTEATQHLQSGDIWCQLGLLQQELKQFDAAWHSFVEAERFWPLADEDSQHKQWLAAHRSDIAYSRGDYRHAIELARQVDQPFYKRFVETLEKAVADPPKRHPRVQLPVPFIRQHHETCAPATMTAIAQYWKKSVKHEEVVERICYEGTQASDERRWAEENGFLAREFCITRESADALIRAGVPFTLNTVEPTSAHLQAIVGIDELRETFLIQDPSERHVKEGQIDKLLERYASTGPRGMVMVPAEEKSRIDSIELPDANMYDFHYQVDRALAEHRRSDAVAAIEAMTKIEAESHRLLLQSRMALARYDGDHTKILALAEELLKQFPDDANLHLIQLSCLADFGRRDQRLQLLRERCSGALTHPVFRARLAAELMDDARDHAEAFRELRSSLRFAQSDGRSLNMYATLMWNRDERTKALDFYRLAASINDKDESQARNYFSAARYLHQTAVVLEWLKDRKQRFGARSSLPGRTLAWAYEQLEQPQRALDLLEDTVKLHPDDGELRCHVALALGRFNRPEQAAAHLEKARGKTSEANYLRSAAALRHYAGQLTESRELYRQVQAIEPLDLSTRERLLSLDMDIDGNEVAEKNLRAAVNEFPHSNSLRVLLIQWLRANRFEAVKEELERFVQLHPQDAWALRETAIVAMLEHDLVKAKTFAERAIASDPLSEVSHYLMGRIVDQQGDIASAREHYRNSIRINVDHEAAISALIDTCDRPKNRAEQLEYVYQQLERQTTFGGGVLAFREAAAGKIEPDALLLKLEQAITNRPDLWQCYTALIQQHMAMNQRQKAVERAVEATERFPLLPRAWVDLALVHRAIGDDEAELAALVRAHDINPTWSDVARELCDTYLNRKQFDEAEKIVRQVLSADPRDAQSLAGLADCLYKAGKKSESFTPLKQACLQQVSYHWAWQSLIDWSNEVDGGETARATAEQVVRERPLDSRSYVRLAEANDDLERMPAAIAAVEKALELDPRNVDAHVRKAYFMGRLHRWDEALEACAPAVFGNDQPVVLQMRRAYMFYRKGQLGEAITALQSALQSDPDHYSAWNQLADWAEEAGRADVYHTAAENLVRIDPHAPVPRGYLADSLLKEEGKRAEAIEHLETALRLSPEYSYATMRLVDLYLDSNQPTEAQRVLAAGGEHITGGYQQGLQLRISIHQELVDGYRNYLAIEELVAWCRTADHKEVQRALIQALDTMHGDMLSSAKIRLAKEIEQTPDCEMLGTALGRLLARNSTKRQIMETLKSAPRGPAWFECMRMLLRSLPTLGLKSDVLDMLRTKFGKPLRTQTSTWVAMANTMLEYGQGEEVIKWTRDWRKRTDLSGMDLISATASRWEKFHISEARKVVAFALAIEGDTTSSLHHVWAGLDALQQGNGQAAMEHAQRVVPNELVGWYPTAYSILVAGCELLAATGTRSEAMRRAVAHFNLKGLGIEGFGNDRLTLWFVARIRASLARAHGARFLAMTSWLQAFYLRWF